MTLAPATHTGVIPQGRPYREFLEAKQQRAEMTGFTPRYRPEFLYDFQAVLLDWATRKGRAAIFADCGLGKAQPIDEPVLTPTGWRPIGTLAPNDQVIAGDGSITSVVGVYPQGIRDIAQVEFLDGAVTRCDWDHLWLVQSENDASRGNAWRILTARELLRRGLTIGACRETRNWRVPVVGAVEYPPLELPIDPYVLGALLGDGSFASAPSVIFTSDDCELVDAISERLPCTLRVVAMRAVGDRTPSYRISAPYAGPTRPSPFVSALRDFGLWGLYSQDKFIPECYALGSPRQREELLRGLLDTDGYIATDGTIQFGSSSERLTRGVIALVRSLGGVARLTSKLPWYSHRGVKRQGLLAWTATVALPDNVIPFALKRKAARHQPREKYQPIRKIASIREVGTAESVCIRVAHPAQLYVTRDYVVTHNTPIQLVWAQNVVEHTNRPVLIVTPLAVSSQTEREARKFSIPAVVSRDGRLSGRAEILITNYERLHYFQPSDFAGVVCDESSILKNFDGVTKAAITEFLRCLSYRLLCTATAAPNDHIELGTSSEALGELGYMDMLSMFFKNDEGSIAPLSYATKWRFKPHAEGPFWQWLCSWARAVRKPSDLGCDDGPFVLPPLREQVTIIESSRPTPGMLFVKPANNLHEQRWERRATIQARCEYVAALACSHDRPFLAWCHLNDEGDLLEKLIPNAVQVSGKDSDDAKVEKFDAFQAGQARLITKPKIGGFGMNWQHCADMSLFPSHSYEQYYQTVRRCWRYGQPQPVNVEIVSTEGEADVLGNLRRKAIANEAMFAHMIAAMDQAHEVTRRHIHSASTLRLPDWMNV